MDINLGYVAFARAQAEAASPLNRRYEVADLHDLPFDDGSFDRAWSALVPFVLPERAAVLSELARVTRPGGAVITSHQEELLQVGIPRDPDLQTLFDRFTAAMFPGWDGLALPTMMRAAELGEIDLRVEACPPYTFIGAASSLQACSLREQFEAAPVHRPDLFDDVADGWHGFMGRWQGSVAREDTDTVTTQWIVTGRKPGP